MAGLSNQSLYDLLRELYTSETWASREYRSGRLSDLEIQLYDKDIQRGIKGSNELKDLVYSSNPFIKLTKKE